MVDVQGLVRRTDAGLSPLMRRLPEVSADLQQTLSAREPAGRLGRCTGYGANSQFSRDLERLMAQLNDGVRSIRLLADFLDRHPEALIRGRANTGSGPVRPAHGPDGAGGPRALARCASPDPAIYTLRAVPGRGDRRWSARR